MKVLVEEDSTLVKKVDHGQQDRPLPPRKYGRCGQNYRHDDSPPSQLTAPGLGSLTLGTTKCQLLAHSASKTNLGDRQRRPLPFLQLFSLERAGMMSRQITALQELSQQLSHNQFCSTDLLHKKDFHSSFAKKICCVRGLPAKNCRGQQVRQLPPRRSARSSHFVNGHRRSTSFSVFARVQPSTGSRKALRPVITSRAHVVLCYSQKEGQGTRPATGEWMWDFPDGSPGR